AAGNGSRLSLSIPKALVPVGGEPCLTSTLRRLAHKFSRIFVITNTRHRSDWETYFHSLGATEPCLARQVTQLPIESGLGDGHATLHGLLAAERHAGEELATDVVITWGDVYFETCAIVDELLALPLMGPGVVPVVFEKAPYVCLVIDNRMDCQGV